MSVDEVKRQELKSRVKALRRMLSHLEEQLDAMNQEAQHEIIETLDPYIKGDDIKRESFMELSEEAWMELKDITTQVTTRCKSFLHKRPPQDETK